MRATVTFSSLALSSPPCVRSAHLLRGLEVVLCLLEGLLLFLAHGDADIADPRLVVCFSIYFRYFSGSLNNRIDHSAVDGGIQQWVYATLQVNSLR